MCLVTDLSSSACVSGTSAGTGCSVLLPVPLLVPSALFLLCLLSVSYCQLGLTPWRLLVASCCYLTLSCCCITASALSTWPADLLARPEQRLDLPTSTSQAPRGGFPITAASRHRHTPLTAHHSSSTGPCQPPCLLHRSDEYCYMYRVCVIYL